MKLVINKSRWLRGEGSSFSFLLRESDRKMCCLGFLALTCGAKPENIENVPGPGWIKSSVEHIKWPEKLWNISPIKFEECTEHYGCDDDYGQFCQQLEVLNDSKKISDETREKYITDLFNLIDVQVTFED